MDSRILACALACGALCMGCTSKTGADSATEDGSSGAVGTSTSTGADVSTGGTTGGTTGATSGTGVEPSTGGSSGVDATGGSTGGVTSGASTTGDATTGEGSSSGSTTGQSPWPIEMCDDILIETGPVQAKTPLGDVALKYAAHDPDGCFGEIGSLVLYLFAETPALDQTVLLGPQTTRLTVELLDPAWQGNWVGEGPVHVIFHVPGEDDVEADGTLKVTMLDDKWLTGELDVTAPGWDLHGGFVAANCMELNGFTLCP